MKQKLELTWVGKNNPPNVEPRILLHKKNFDYGETDTENILIHGDNLLALKSLEQDFAGKIKCVYIDPPYNTGAAFEHYDDNLEHSIWLNFMAARLKIQIDDNEHAYLKILCDEIFGRNNFVANIIWRKKTGGGQDSEYFAVEHENILVYKKNNWAIVDEFAPKNLSEFTYEINNKPAKLLKLEKWGTSSHKEDRPSLYYPIKDPDGNDFYPLAPDGQDGRWRKKPETLDDEHIYWLKRQNRWTPYEVIYFEEANDKKIKTRSIWLDYGNNTEATNELKELFGNKNFDTPKPEKLLKKILEVATSLGDIVLDSFLGSGTTAAVAHKMGRRWIGIELEKTCFTHCIPRLKKVIDGEQGGISKNVNWQGGGGFKFYELAPTLIVKDKFGMEIFNPQYDSEMLAAAVAKHNGFIFMPDENIFWKQGKSQENSFIYTTTNYLTTKYLDEIAREMRENENLLICAPAFDVGLNERYENISVKKIPQSLLKKCEYDVENYYLKISEGIDGDG